VFLGQGGTTVEMTDFKVITPPPEKQERKEEQCHSCRTVSNELQRDKKNQLCKLLA